MAVPLSQHLSEEYTRHIIQEARVSCCFVTASEKQRFLRLAAELPADTTFHVFDCLEGAMYTGLEAWSQAMRSQAVPPVAPSAQTATPASSFPRHFRGTITDSSGTHAAMALRLASEPKPVSVLQQSVLFKLDASADPSAEFEAWYIHSK